MSEVRPQDILLRVSPKMLDRYQSLCVAGAGRGRVNPLPYTFTRADATTCATVIGRDGLIRKVPANVLRFEHVDLDGDGILETPGILLEGTRTNVVLWNRDLTNAAWVKSGGGGVTAVKDQTGVDGVASSASRITANGANGTCLQSITLASSQRFQTCYIKRLVGTGNIDMTMDNGSTWTTLTVTSSWARVKIPTQTLANPIVGFRIVTNADSVAIDFVQNENGAFESSAIPTTTLSVVRAADSITVPFNWGTSRNLTVLARVARPVHVDVAGTLGLFPQVFVLGNRSIGGSFESSFSSTSRDIGSEWWWTAGSNVSRFNGSLPAGGELAFAYQLKNARTAPQVTLDLTGAGMLSFSSVGTPLPAFGSQILTCGTNLFGVLLDLPICGDLFTRAEMLAIP